MGGVEGVEVRRTLGGVEHLWVERGSATRYGRSNGEKRRTMRTEWPNALGGRFERNLARTMPDPPWGRVTLPQMMRTLEPEISFWAV